MKVIDISSVQAWEIDDVLGLDPIHIYWHDLSPSKGRLIVECYGVAWSAYWGGMGGQTLQEFVGSVDSAYLAGCLSPGNRKQSGNDLRYLRRITDAVVAAVKERKILADSEAD